LGSIYEGFLEFQLHESEYSMVYEKKQWKKADLKSLKYKNQDIPKVQKGELFFTPDNKERKATGSYYTPEYIVKYIVEETLSPLVNDKSSDEILKLKVCDASMGSAHFLVTSLNFLTEAYLSALGKESEGDLSINKTQAKRIILEKCIFGVDINPRAVKLAFLSLWLATANAEQKLEPLDDQLICGNLLLEKNLWTKFKNIEFDAFVQNPPYIGEKGNKHLFEPVKVGWLKEFYIGKMDYFYFFMHVALNLLKDGGRAGFITTNYFPTAAGGVKLRKDMELRCSKINFVQLNSNKVFTEASGQHNIITNFEKGSEDVKLSSINIKNQNNFQKETFEDLVLSTSSDEVFFEGKERYLRFSNEDNKNTSSLSAIPNIIKLKAKYVIGDVLNVNTGIQTGADKLSERHIKKYKIDGKKNDGIFILTTNEVKEKKIEKEYLRPFFKNSDVVSFSCSIGSDCQIIYMDREEKDVKVNTKDHLDKFKKILDSRREVKNGTFPWFQLHWPRERTIFESEKIVVPQRSSKNTFGYNEIPWYASADVYFITQKNDHKGINLKTLCGLLNSKLYYVWLYYRGKRKGEALELYQKPLAEIPIPEISKDIEKIIRKEVEKLIAKNTDLAAFKKLNEIIYELFSLNKKQIDAVEDFYNSKFMSKGKSKNKNDNLDLAA
jgi:adenine-specific DNA-methyltransferase